MPVYQSLNDLWDVGTNCMLRRLGFEFLDNSNPDVVIGILEQRLGRSASHSRGYRLS
jgi:hypothetical protein